MMGSSDITLKDVIAGGKPVLARALASLERSPESEHSRRLLDSAYAAPKAQVVGVTGPPGVGKSTLLGALIAALREQGRSVGVIAVDPSSRRSGGALLGDRLRLLTDPDDPGVFVRSMAARDRLGGLAELTVAAMVLMRAVYDVVLIETVGVGQSETDVAQTADSVLFCVQPASGDSLQFMKAGIVEIPHVAVVTKADLGAAAQRALTDLKSALSLNQDEDGWLVQCLSISAQRGEDAEAVMALLDRHYAYLEDKSLLKPQRRRQAESWLQEAVRERYGRVGLNKAGRLTLTAGESPFSKLADVTRALD